MNRETLPITVFSLLVATLALTDPALATARFDASFTADLVVTGFEEIGVGPVVGVPADVTLEGFSEADTDLDPPGNPSNRISPRHTLGRAVPRGATTTRSRWPDQRLLAAMRWATRLHPR